MNSKFAEHPPSLDNFFPSLFCNSFFFFPSFAHFQELNVLNRTVPCNGFVYWRVCVCVIYTYIFFCKNTSLALVLNFGLETRYGLVFITLLVDVPGAV